MPLALIDGDVIAYRCAASCEPNKSTRPDRRPVQLAISRADELMYRILSTTQSQEHRVFISGGGNFRKSLYPAYKANRERLAKPVHLEACREFLVREWGATVCDGYEADDAIGIAHSEDPKAIICSNDKDFKQLVGEHYNFVKDEFEVVDSQMAALAFYSQMLIGDASDNVPGIAGLGEARAPRLLRGLSPEEMHTRVSEIYGDERRFALNFRLLRILQSVDEWREVETTISESKGQEPAEDSSREDIGDISGADEE